MNNKELLSALPPGISAQEGDLMKVASEKFESLVMQDARVFKAGNSLAIRIPSAIAKHCDLEDGAPVQMTADRGMILVRKAPSATLTDLIDQITPDNIHAPQFENVVSSERW